jgi:hypothetical protein
MEALLFWVVLLGGPACAVAALIAAQRPGDSSWLNLGIVLAPPVLFFAVAASAGTQDQGLGLTLWPIVVVLVGSFALALKVFAVDRVAGVSARTTSLTWFAALSVGSMVFAMRAPLWFE